MANETAQRRLGLDASQKPVDDFQAVGRPDKDKPDVARLRRLKEERGET